MERICFAKFIKNYCTKRLIQTFFLFWKHVEFSLCTKLEITFYFTYIVHLKITSTNNIIQCSQLK